MKHLLTMLLVCFAIGVQAVETPTIHSTVMLDARFFGGDAANNNVYDTSNRFQVRKMAIGLEGRFGYFMRYNVEAGVATCVGVGDQLKLMDAELMYEVTPDIALGIKQGHVMRSFSSITECATRLGMEKPVFAKTFGVCHPLGFVAEAYIPLGDMMGLETELALLDGASGTLDGESDYNLGMILRLPIDGLSAIGSYNMNDRIYYDENYEKFTDTGYRAVGGVNYLAHGVWVTTEYFTGKGFERDDQAMEAWYAQAGYEFKLGLQRLDSVQPYIKIESWDKDSDAGDSLGHLYRYSEAGVNLNLSRYSRLRCAWRTTIQSPDNVVEDPSSLIIRLQTGF